MYNAAERWLSTLREFNLLKAKGPAVLNIEYNSFGYGPTKRATALAFSDTNAHIAHVCNVCYVLNYLLTQLS